MMPLRDSFVHPSAFDGSIKDYRSVIDDLTIRNKRLGSELRRYQRKDRKSSGDNLIEVRMSGLTAPKKRELEGTLKRFVRNLNQPLKSPKNSSIGGPLHLNSLATTAQPESSHTSTKFVDSGYGSLATSNRGVSQLGLSKLMTADNKQTCHTNDVSRARNHSIRSYLHDIPEGLLPRHSPAVMTEEAKKKLVVARLEHLFSGHRATVDGHLQPEQQQEVSQIAARDDRSAIEARGQHAALEGKREADIMADEVDDTGEIATQQISSILMEKNGLSGKSSTHNSAEQPLVEQRPTRPLDLDPHRAQDPQTNIDYLRHLGFHMSDMDLDQGPSTDRGWLYLNLIMSLAQLHTLNVTIGLVQDAIQKYSSRFELSADGRKIRWRALPLTHTLESSSIDAPSVNSANKSSSDCSRKRVRPADLEATSSVEISDPLTSRESAVPHSGGKMYNGPPCDALPVDSEVADSSQMQERRLTSSHSACEAAITQYPSTRTSSGNLLSQADDQYSLDDGLLIFHKQQKYFTDLSKDQIGASQTHFSDYHVRSMQPLGLYTAICSGTNSLMDSPRTSIQTAVSNASLDVHADASSVNDRRSMHSDSRDKPVLDVLEPYNFEASGIGAVHPSDNFALYVTRQLKRGGDGSPPKRRKLSGLHYITESQPSATASVVGHVTAVKRQLLLPSPLPPAVYAVSYDGSDAASNNDEEMRSSYGLTEPSCDSSNNSSARESEASSCESSRNDMNVDYHIEADDDMASLISTNRSGFTNYQGRLRAMEPLQAQSERLVRLARRAHTGRMRSRSPSVDLLATARAADPQTIRRQEREYDAEMAEKLAEEIHAGSSAATFSGQDWSSHNSPAVDVDQGGRDGNDDRSADDDTVDDNSIGVASVGASS